MVLAAEEVVEPDLVQRRGARVGGDVAADGDARALRPVHHDRGVPADVGPDAPFDVLVAGEPRLALRRDGVDVVGAAQRRHADLLLAAALEQPQHHVSGALTARMADDGVERVEPFLRLVGIDVGKLAGQPVGDDRPGGAGLLDGIAVLLLRCTHVPIVSLRGRRRHVACRCVEEECGTRTPIGPSGTAPAPRACITCAMPYASATVARCDGSVPPARPTESGSGRRRGGGSDMTGVRVSLPRVVSVVSARRRCPSRGDVCGRR